MSEKLHLSQKLEQLPGLEDQQEHSHREILERARLARHEHLEALENIKLQIAKEAAPTNEIVVDKEHLERSKEQLQPLLVDKKLKAEALADTLTQINAHLTPAQRSLSRLIHRPMVEKISDAAAKTVARPSVLLGGGLFTLIGGIGLLYVSKRYGYEYRFSAFLLLLAIGVVAGLAVEFMVFVLSPRKRG